MQGIGGAHGMREYFCKPSLPQGVAHAVALEPVCPASGLSSHPPGTSVQVESQLEPTDPDCLAPPSGCSDGAGMRLSWRVDNLSTLPET